MGNINLYVIIQFVKSFSNVRIRDARIHIFAHRHAYMYYIIKSKVQIKLPLLPLPLPVFPMCLERPKELVEPNGVDEPFPIRRWCSTRPNRTVGEAKLRDVPFARERRNIP